MGVILPPVGFPLITQKWWQKSVTLVFCSIQEHFIRDIHAKFGIPNSLQSHSFRRGYFRFPDSGQSLIKGNCHNSRTSDDIDMKLRPVTNPQKRNKITSKKVGRWHHVGKLWRHYQFSNLWPIWSYLEAGFQSNEALTLLHWVKVLFLPKKFWR